MIQRLESAGVPLVLATAMTLDEITPLAAELGLRDPMIIEAGGAIARWSADSWQVEACGPTADVLLDAVGEIENRSGASLLVYSALPESEAARLSGRFGERLRASMRRSFSEPFVIERGDLRSVRRAAAEIGFSICRVGHFLYLRDRGAGEAFNRVRDELRCDTAIALRASELDADVLARADVPIVVTEPGEWAAAVGAALWSDGRLGRRRARESAAAPLCSA